MAAVNAVQDYDEPTLVRLLTPLSRASRAAFGLACVDRELHRSGPMAAIEELLTATWPDLEGWRTGDPEIAVLPARLTYENADERVLLSGAVDVNQPGAAARILADPDLQRELAQQRLDLEVLHREPLSAAVALLRSDR